MVPLKALWFYKLSWHTLFRLLLSFWLSCEASDLKLEMNIFPMCLKIQYQPFSTQVYAEADLYGQYQWARLISGFQLGSANGRHWQDKKNCPEQEEYGCHVSSQASSLLSCRGLTTPLYQRPQPLDGPLFILSSAPQGKVTNHSFDPSSLGWQCLLLLLAVGSSPCWFPLTLPILSWTVSLQNSPWCVYLCLLFPARTVAARKPIAKIIAVLHENSVTKGLKC